MAIEETVSAEDMMAVTPKSKGKMDFPRSAANVAKKIMGQQLSKGLPKQWRGGGDYFFERQDDGSLKITGGDKAKSLTGGKSVTITDNAKIKEIYEKARGGDILEEDVSYKFKTRGRGDFDSPEEYGVAIKERLEESTPEAEDIAPVTDFEEAEEVGVSDLKEGTRGLQAERQYRNPTMEAANYLLSEMARRPDIKDVLQRALDALGVDVQSAEKVEEGV